MIKADTSIIKQQFAKLLEGLGNAVQSGLNNAAATGETRAKTVTYYKPRSPSGLQASTYAQTLSDYQRQIIANKYYASWVNDGNGPPGGRIYPRTAKALRFRINGEIVFRKWVRASQPKPFMTETHKMLETYFPQAMEAAISQFISRL